MSREDEVSEYGTRAMIWARATGGHPEDYAGQYAHLSLNELPTFRRPPPSERKLERVAKSLPIINAALDAAFRKTT